MVFSYHQGEKISEVLSKHRVEYLFIGKSGAIFLGYPDTTQDADLFIKKDEENKKRLARALRELGFRVTRLLQKDIGKGKDFIQIRNNGPFDLDLIFAPDGIERFEDAKKKALLVGGKFPVAHIDDIIGSKKAANRERDRIDLPRLESFARYLKKHWPENIKPLEEGRSVFLTVKGRGRRT